MSPSEVLNIYEELFIDSFFEKAVSEKGGFCFSLTESSPDTKLRKMNVRGVPEDSILLKLQLFPPLEKVFKSTLGKRCRCDYILISCRDEEIWTIFIEMKSKKLDKAHIRQQFKGADCFLTYCNAVAEKFHSAKLDSCKIQYRYVVFFTNHNTKTPISSKNDFPLHATPERAKYLQVGTKKSNEGTVWFGQLI
jgi:hypothetical protein